ncbi:hypothetical protein ANCCAN_14524 [Ancylostoma caninum]|uniref:Phlebovirus glycoprotein G2 fusion domain-containing protein n=1 Tax=Ancylostoma caninum TaxID=29170 RepID=A0A368G5C1_ANCCA|nr:hypothetical protein ANCCAN_14524 [Ancylostoma caninum]
MHGSMYWSYNAGFQRNSLSNKNYLHTGGRHFLYKFALSFLNPECSPRAAIIATAVGLYITTALIYVLCYVPVTLGLPCRILCNLLAFCIRAVPRAGFRTWQHLRRRREQFRRTPRIDVLLNTPLLAVVLLACISAAESCQNVDIFELKTNVCILSSTGNETCTIDTTQMLKLNTSHQQACFRIQKKGELLKEIRLEWKKLQLICDRQTIMFTRNTQQKVVDSKRCPRSGSCKEEKCARINTTALLLELRQGNDFPGVTFCVESCGGPGCGCFYISSGCLFYRVYAVPADDDIYEIFRCPRWREEVVIKMTTIQPDRGEQESVVILQPTVPQERGAAKLTLSSITIPPTPALQTPFITNGKNTAKWIINDPPTLQCASREAAKSLECDIQTNCRCQPAENSVNCACIDNNITNLFHSDLQNLLSIRRPWIEFEETFVEENITAVKATIPSLSTTEILVTIKEGFDSTFKGVTHSICTVDDDTIEGCYQCPQGAVAKIFCQSRERPTLASIVCDETAFTVPCDPQGVTSPLRFTFNHAQVRNKCESSCGGIAKHQFEIAGVLH